MSKLPGSDTKTFIVMKALLDGATPKEMEALGVSPFSQPAIRQSLKLVYGFDIQRLPDGKWKIIGPEHMAEAVRRLA